MKYEEESGIVPISLVNNKEVEVQFKKVDASDRSGLKDAQFKLLYKNSKDGAYSDTDIILYKFEGTIYALKSTDTPPTGYKKIDNLTSGADGLFKFKVNVPGFYAIKETRAPSGYIAQKGEFAKEFSLENGEIKIDGKKPTEPIEIENMKVTLPNTNGLASWIGFTLMGLVVMVLAGFYYNKKKVRG